MFTQRQFYDSLKITLSENDFLSKILRPSYLKVPSLSNKRTLDQEGEKVAGSILIILKSKTEKNFLLCVLPPLKGHCPIPTQAVVILYLELREECSLTLPSCPQSIL